MADSKNRPPARKAAVKPAEPKSAPRSARKASPAPDAPKAAAKAAGSQARVTGAAAPKPSAPELDLKAPAPAPSPGNTGAAPASAAMRVMEAAVEAAKPLSGPASRAPVAAAVENLRSVLKAAPKADEVVAPAARLMEAGAERARDAYARAQATGEHLRQAVNESAIVTTRGALEVNGKVIEALRAQTDAAFDLWRQALSAGSLSEAVRLQTSGVRQVYETAASHWKDVAETTTRWLGSTVKPIQSAIEQTRRG